MFQVAVGHSSGWAARGVVLVIFATMIVWQLGFWLVQILWMAGIMTRRALSGAPPPRLSSSRRVLGLSRAASWRTHWRSVA